MAAAMAVWMRRVGWHLFYGTR